ncbi:hypothetical protein Brsp05_04478 [Brucella sp. NBRC 12953]|uniref:hypothetical protein n=1 Tax=Brucella sp. NBRC 12953 TaxID=3075481 RepID=UPI0030B43EA9
MITPFEALREELLTAGIKPGYVKRYLCELTQHFHDLRDHLEDQGNSPSRAETLAFERIGHPRDLLQAMISQPKLRSLPASYPKTTLLLAPLALLHLAILGLVAAALMVVRLAEPGDPDQIGRMVTFLCNLGMPMLFGWSAVFLSIRHRLTALWTVAGLIMLAALSSAIDVRTMLPHVDMPGEITVRIGELHMVLASFLALLITSLVPYLSLCRWLRHKSASVH